MIERRARSLFSSNEFAEARFTLCFRNYWCRGLIDDTTKADWNSASSLDFKKIFDGIHPQMVEWFDR